MSLTFEVRYRWWRLRCRMRALPDAIAWRVAWLLPRKVALFAFIRVYGSWGECGPEYAAVCDAWAAKAKRTRPERTAGDGPAAYGSMQRKQH